MTEPDRYISEWLTDNETIFYDTKLNNLHVIEEDRKVVIDGVKYRGVVTNKRTLLIGENILHDMYHGLVSAITWQRKILYWLLVLGIVLIISGGVINYYSGNISGGFRSADENLKISSYTIIAGGVASIIVFIFYRPETIRIFGAGREMGVTGPRHTLKNIMQEIRKQQS